MKTDELGITMFDEVKVTPTGQDGKPVSDFTVACEEFKKAHARFQHWDAHHEKLTDRWVHMEWWACLNKLSEAEQRVQKIFIGPEPPSLKCKMQYCLFRQLFLEGQPTKANA